MIALTIAKTFIVDMIKTSKLYLTEMRMVLCYKEDCVAYKVQKPKEA